MKNKSDFPVVSIVGRPNVGKSSLFNRFVGKRHAVVEEKEGTTRDRNEKLIKLKDKTLTLVDTGGFLPEADKISSLIKKQIEKAIYYSDILIFVCDGSSGLLPLDMDLANFLRKSGKKIILVVNKIDNEKMKEELFDFYKLGLGEPFGISCSQNRGVNDLIDEVSDVVPVHSEAMIEREHPIKIAIVGRPNVGKSSFLNKVLEEERVIVHDEPGTTRDSIDSYFKKDGILFLLIDTAGIRHKRKVKSAVDVYSMMRARDSIDRSDVSILLIDGLEGVRNDDTKIFDYIVEQGKGCILVVNKWDLVKDIEMARYMNAVLRKMPCARNFPVFFISAKSGRNVLKAFNLVKVTKTNSDLFINTSTLKAFLKEIKPEEVRISRRKRIPKFYYMIQASTSPKEFVIFVNDPKKVTNSHTSFIENRLRESFPLEGVPIKFFYKRLGRQRSK